MAAEAERVVQGDGPGESIFGKFARLGPSTMSSVIAGSRLSMLMVGGTRRSCSAKTPRSTPRHPRLRAGDQSSTSWRSRQRACGIVAERSSDGECLGDIALRGAGAVGVDVHDVGRR